MRQPYGTSILDTAIRLVIPFYLLYAVYVLIHGHYSPGGGFQAGVALAASMILVQMVQGERAQWGIGKDKAVLMACLGTFIYAGIGLLTPFWGGNVLDYGVLPLGDYQPKIRAWGTLGVETGVTLAVMGVFVTIYNLLIGKED